MQRPLLAEMNLNLLLALDALLAERSVSRAAARIGVTQPAMSQSLRHLRALFDDALLVRDRGAMVPTPRAEGLGVPLRQALVELQRALDGDAGFDPATAQRRFTLAAGDHVAVTLLPALLEQISAQAPGVDIDVRPLEVRRLQDVLTTGEVDVAMSAGLALTGELVQQTLYTSGFACLVRRGHPAVRGTLDLAQYVALPHALISPRGEGASVVDTVLEAMGKRRRVALRVPYFLAAPLIVARSDLILTAPRLLAETFARTHPLQLIEPPLELPTFDIVQVWHGRYQHDPGHRWLRHTIAASSSG